MASVQSRRAGGGLERSLGLGLVFLLNERSSPIGFAARVLPLMIPEAIFCTDLVSRLPVRMYLF